MSELPQTHYLTESGKSSAEAVNIRLMGIDIRKKINIHEYRKI